MAVPPPKSALRKELRARRDAHVAGLGLAGRCAAAVLLRGHVAPFLGGMGVIAAYLPIGSEADPSAILDALAAAGRAIALPHYAGPRGAPRFLAWRPGEPLVDGPLGLRQPPATAPEVAPATILTPLLAFDPARHRLGYGAGYYDRAFARFPHAYRIGLAWDCQRVECLPVDPWDRPLHAVATEAGVVT